jgi:hypothetical protein
MKRIYIFLTIGFLSIACEDKLDLAPLDAYSNSSLWKSASDAEAALTGCYASWDWEYYNSFEADDSFTDDGYNQFHWTGQEPFVSGLATPSNPGVSYYNYERIMRCNWFLANVDQVPASSLDDALRARMKGEARFLRAYVYFLLSQHYGAVPFILEPISTAEANNLIKTPKDEITEFILEELAEIAADLPLSYSGGNIGRITRGAALALKARVELFNEKYTECIATCEQLMSTPFNYELYPNYGNLFRPQYVDAADNHEVIWDIQHLKNYFQFGFVSLVPNSYGGWSQFTPTQALVDAFETINGKTIDQDPSYDPLQPYNNRDPRLDATIIRPGSLYMGKYFDPLNPDSPDATPKNNASKTGYNIRKYIANLDDYNNTDYGVNFNNTGASIIVFRYAEILLTYAEAKIEANSIDASVYDAINKVRDRAGLPDALQADYPSQSSLRTLVRRERRVELACEGLRYYDIQRWRIGADVIKDVYGAPTGSVDPNTGELTLNPNSNIFVKTRTFDEKYYLFPIPQTEINLNKKLNPNNPGY